MNGTIASDSCQSGQQIETGKYRWAKSLALQLLKKLQHGTIILCDGGNLQHFGNGELPRVRIIINHPAAWKQILFGGSIGAAEAYINKLWDVDDLTGLVRIMVANMTLLDRMERGFAWLLAPVRLLSHKLNRNSRRGAKANILSHYDLGNNLYKAFLDPTMMYSSALYPHDNSSLEEAAIYKLETICKKLDLQPEDEIIEIGSGWGGFAIYAATNYGCRVTTTTISDAQYKEARKRIDELGLSDRITLLKSDYRDLSGRYDKLVSIEMIEAVGNSFLPSFFTKCRDLLKEHGTMLLQAITITDQKYKQYLRGVDFIQRFIFPGGCVVSNNRMVELFTGRTDMVVRDLHDFGYDYARTLRDWRHRFHKALPQLEKEGYDERFRRLWDFYFAYCEGGFLERAISVVQLVATRPKSRLVIRPQSALAEHRFGT